LSKSKSGSRDIHFQQLTCAVAVSDSVKEENRDLDPKSRSMFGIRKKSKKSELYSVWEVRLEASQSNEYLLLNDEEWIMREIWTSTIMEWLRSKLGLKKKVYLIVGYPTYVDSKVSEEDNRSEMGSRNSLSLSVPMITAAKTQYALSGRSLNSGLFHLSTVDVM
jgi:hypothetical protein